MFPFIILPTLLRLMMLDLITAGSITFQNRSPAPICYKVELSQGSIPTNSICDFAPGILINSTGNYTTSPQAAFNTTIWQNVTLHPTPDFNGAITAMTMNGTKGARHEINFEVAADGTGHTWYDIDYEMGISNSTLGPADRRNRTNGLSSLAGEVDCLAKANDAWALLQPVEKFPLLPHYYYLDHRTESGNLSVIRMDKKAPFAVMEFFQLRANFSGYVGSGSVAGVVVDPESREGRAVRKQDEWSFEIGTQEMVITAY